MIRVTHLSKTYKAKSKKQASTHAVNGISFDLPDTGMVFIVGKSGSGKSTILNILGGLDDFDSGEVIVDGNNLKEMNHADFNKYRSGYVSFIFQDHFLINELKVKDNIALGLNVVNEHDMDKVKAMLDKVDLSTKFESMPMELSGGERQRVAVARAIIKNPKLILCDEPTGNLDIKTTKLIFDILKELSKDRLVVVVSHDMDNALIYADRIIEIFGGKILTDKTKNNDYNENIEYDGTNLVIPKNKIINENDIEYINTFKDVSYKLGDEPYSNTLEIKKSERIVKLKTNKFYRGRINNITKSFILRRLKRMIVTTIIISIIIACFAVFSSLYSFNGDYEIVKKYKDNNVENMLIRRNYFVDSNPGDSLRHDDRLYPISDSDINKLRESGYEGNIHKVYNYGLFLNQRGILYENFNSDTESLGNFYAKDNYGAICCDEEYLKDKFGYLEVIKGNIYEKQGIIITDYMADSLIKANLNISSYDDLVGKYDFASGYDSYVYIKAIIKTDYKEELKEYLDIANANNGQLVDKDNPYNNEKFGEFCRLIQTKYGLSYTFSTDFLEDNISRESLGWIPMRFVNIEANGVEYGVVNAVSAVKFAYSGLNKGEAYFSLKYYNTIFNANYSVDNMDEFEPVTITIRKYYDSTKMKSKEIYGEAKIKITKLYDSATSHDLFIREDDYYLFKDVSTINYGLLLDDVESSIKCIDNITTDYYIADFMVSTINVLSKYVFVFKKVALLVAFILSILTAIYLVFYEISNISSNKREIGILKACGLRQRTISKIFILQQILLCIMVIVTSLILSYGLIKIADNLLQTSIKKYADLYISGITLIRFRPSTMMISLVSSVVVIMASCAIPILLLTRIKPMNIIKAKE